MVAALVPGVVIGVAGELSPVQGQVVPAVLLSLHPQSLDGPEDDLGLLLHIVILAMGQKGEVQVAQVVVNRATTRQTADKMSAVCFQCLDAALVGCVLVASDHHRALVLPQVEDALARLHGPQQHLFHGQVPAGICLLRGHNRKGSEHSSPPVSQMDWVIRFQKYSAGWETGQRSPRPDGPPGSRGGRDAGSPGRSGPRPECAGRPLRPRPGSRGSRSPWAPP